MSKKNNLNADSKTFEWKLPAKKYTDIPLDPNFALPPSQDFALLMLPKGIVTDFAKVPSVKIFQQERVLKIYVAQIHSPSKFWFMRVEDSQNLRTLMENLHDCYRELFVDKDDSYNIPEHLATEGTLCAALYDFVWHRAVILGAPIARKVNVLYIDYGTIAAVSLDDIQFLLEEFASFPYYLMRGRLALVAPKETKNDLQWNEAVYATDKFFDIVHQKELHAVLYAYEKDENIYHLILHEHPIPGANQMSSVNEKLALATEYRLATSRTEQWPTREELYPTFDMLENNKFPTIDRLLKVPHPASYWDKKKTADYYGETNIFNKQGQRIVYDNPFDEYFRDTLEQIKVRLVLKNLIKSPKEPKLKQKPVQTNPFVDDETDSESSYSLTSFDESVETSGYSITERMQETMTENNPIPASQSKAGSFLRKFMSKI